MFSGADDLLWRALDHLGATLADRGLVYEVVVVGSAALVLQGRLVRTTQDVDAIAIAEAGEEPRPVATMPGPLRDAVKDVATALDLDEDWLNVGVTAFVPPIVLSDVLPGAAMQTRGGLRLRIADRIAIAKLKLYAAVDDPMAQHVEDLRGLSLEGHEIATVVDWFRTTFPRTPRQEWEPVVGRVAAGGDT